LQPPIALCRAQRHHWQLRLAYYCRRLQLLPAALCPLALQQCPLALEPVTVMMASLAGKPSLLQKQLSAATVLTKQPRSKPRS
jgi:hypothetical protein